jgi:hypothetical protein
VEGYFRPEDKNTARITRGCYYDLTQIDWPTVKLALADGKPVVGFIPVLSTIHGYRFHWPLSIGAGMGLESMKAALDIHEDGSEGGTSRQVYVTCIPVFLDFRLDLSGIYPVPFIFADVGYNWILQKSPETWSYYGWNLVGWETTVSDYTSRGLYMAAGIGISTFVSRSVSITISVKYTRQNLMYDEKVNENWGIGNIRHSWYFSMEETIHLLGLSLGVSWCKTRQDQ